MEWILHICTCRISLVSPIALFWFRVCIHSRVLHRPRFSRLHPSRDSLDLGHSLCTTLLPFLRLISSSIQIRPLGQPFHYFSAVSFKALLQILTESCWQGMGSVMVKELLMNIIAKKSNLLYRKDSPNHDASELFAAINLFTVAERVILQPSVH